MPVGHCEKGAFDHFVKTSSAMKLTQKQHEKLVEHVKTKWAAPASCSVCKANDWIVGEVVFEAREFYGGNLVIGSGSIMPMCPITCKTCGHMVLINPLVAGLDLKEELK